MRCLGFAASVFLMGCGINEGGLLEVLDGSSDVAIDVTKDVTEEPFVCVDAGIASCTDAVAFRTPALFSPDAAAPCPSGYDTHDLALATTQSATCQCKCSDGGPPSCDTSTSNYKFGFGGGMCGAGSGNTPLNGACTTFTNTTVPTENLQIDPPLVVGGCTGGTSLPPATTTAKARLCTPQCASDERVCAAQGALRACVSVAGDVGSCPPTHPTGPFHVGSNPKATCDNCICTQAGNCTSSTTDLYTDTGCQQGDQSFAMDGICHALTGGQINTFRSANVKPSLTGAACNVTEGAAKVEYDQDSDFTVCCQ